MSVTARHAAVHEMLLGMSEHEQRFELLADLGAQVIKIEDPGAGGDVGRGVPPGAANGSSLYFEAFNRSKQSVTLDLSTPAGQEALHALVAHADAVFNNLRGDLPGTVAAREGMVLYAKDAEKAAAAA